MTAPCIVLSAFTTRVSGNARCICVPSASVLPTVNDGGMPGDISSGLATSMRIFPRTLAAPGLTQRRERVRAVGAGEDEFAERRRVSKRAILAEALAAVQATGERWGEAELYHLRGGLFLRQTGTPQDEAETWLRRALDVTRRQEAKSLELRAAMRLSRLWQQQSKRAEARQLLAEVYEWFIEGFDTADLQEAKALLEELAG